MLNLIKIFIAITMALQFTSKYDIANVQHLSSGDTDVYDNNINSYQHFKEAYFDNLTSNFGKNVRGSCGIVSIGQLLSYYDTFFDDSIIPEQYDVPCIGYESNMICTRNYPGVWGIDSSNDDYLNSDSYLEYLQNLDTENSFHAYLLDLGINNNIFDELDRENLEFGTDQNERIDLLTKYFLTSNITNYTIYSEDSNHFSVREFVIEQIVYHDRPVLLGMSHNGANGHVMIAYEYNEVSDKIYCNMGFNAGTTRVVPEEFYNYNFNVYECALSISFSGNHSHSNNFKLIENGTTSFHCFDSNSLITTHLNHSFVYNSYNNYKHKKRCYCGIDYLENHNFTLNQFNPGLFYIPMYVCNDCNFETRVLPVEN